MGSDLMKRMHGQLHCSLGVRRQSLDLADPKSFLFVHPRHPP